MRTHNIWAKRREKKPSNVHKVCMRKYHQGSCSPFYSILLVESEGPDQTAQMCIVDVQADLGLCYPHMSEAMFSHSQNVFFSMLFSLLQNS